MPQMIDKLVKEMMGSAVEESEVIRSLIHQLAIESLRETRRLLRYGKPEVKIAVARTLLPVLVRGAVGEEKDNTVEKAKEEIRRMFSEVWKEGEGEGSGEGEGEGEGERDGSGEGSGDGDEEDEEEVGYG